MAFDSSGAMGGAASGAMLGATLAAPTGGLSVPVGALLGAVGGLGMGFLGGKKSPQIDITAEMNRINALYEQARVQGSAVITQDFQAQRGELAQSQAARGIYRSGVSQLGLARLGAARQQALGSFNAQISAGQAGASSNLLNALLGRKTALDSADADRSRQGLNQAIGSVAGLAGAFAQSRMAPTTPQAGGYNFFGSNMVAPPKPTPQGFFQTEFAGASPSYGQPAPSYAGGGSGMNTPFF
jgi:hypothetical protein